MFKLRIFISIITFSSLMLFTSFIKNQTREIEKNISNLSKEILIKDLVKLIHKLTNSKSILNINIRHSFTDIGLGSEGTPAQMLRDKFVFLEMYNVNSL